MHWLVTKSLQLGQAVGHRGLGQAGGSSTSRTHPTRYIPRALPGLQWKLLEVGRGETQLHLTLVIPFWRLELGRGE